MNPYDAAHMLARALKESPEYREYNNLKDKVQHNPSTKSMLKDFRKKQFAMQARQLSGQHVTEDEIQKLQNLQNILLQNPVVGPFFHAEYRISQIMNDVYRILGEAVDMEMSDELKELSEELKKEAETLKSAAKDDQEEAPAEKEAPAEEPLKEKEAPAEEQVQEPVDEKEEPASA
ncbi:MAG: YlbF family regulator [Bacillota bacterium]|nr:YlbF family regulator [Bacillota bacterium]